MRAVRIGFLLGEAEVFLMARFWGAVSAAVLVVGLGCPGRAADANQANAILDKAVKGLGGEEELRKVKAASWKTKGTVTFMGNDNEITTQTIVQGLHHLRREFEGDFGGNMVKGVTVVAGDKAWRKFGDSSNEIEQDRLANEKRMVYLAVIPITILPLKSKEFKVEAIGEAQVDGKPAAGIKATGPDGKDFTLYFDKENGLPVRTVAKVLDFMGNEVTEETTFSDYKMMGNIKKATKIQSKHDGEKFLDQRVTEFKVLDKVDAKTFTEPD
jgi:hypothetical protein